jgi:hypothetical protein
MFCVSCLIVPAHLNKAICTERYLPAETPEPGELHGRRGAAATARGRRKTADSKRIAGRIGEDVLVAVLDLDRFVHGSDPLMAELAEERPFQAVVGFVLIIHVTQDTGQGVAFAPLQLITKGEGIKV